MFLHIFARDIKRRKVMNTILLVFVIIASMFTASAISNFFSILAGVDYFADISETGDYIILSGDEGETDRLTDYLENSEDVKGYRKNQSLFLSSDGFESDNEDFSLGNAQILETPIENGFKFFDANDNVITKDTIKDGEIYFTEAQLSAGAPRIGDRITIKYGDKSKEFTVAGGFKDAIFGSGMASGRILISNNDFEYMLEDTIGTEVCSFSMIYVDTDNVNALESYIQDFVGIQDKLEKSKLTMFYMIPMIISGIFLLAGIILMVVSFLILRFSIAFSVQEEYREIGVMKAIGIGNRRIRSIFTTKYIFLGLIGSVIGLALSFPFQSLMNSLLNSHMVTGNFVGPVLNLAGAVIVFVLIVLFAYRFTGIVKKSSPIDAIRNGQTGERYKQKSVLKLSKGRSKTSFFMAVNDLLSSPRKYISVVVIFTLCILLTMILANAVKTLRSDDLVITCGFVKSDSYIILSGEEANTVYINGSLEAAEDVIKDIEDELNENGMPCFCHSFSNVDIKLSYGDSSKTCMAKKPIGISASEYSCYEGSAPTKADEIAITGVIADYFDVGIGDTLTIETANGKANCIITGLTDDMNSFSNSILVHEDFDFGENALYKFVGSVDVIYTDNPSEEVKEQRLEKIKELYPDREILTAGELAEDITSCASILAGVEYGLMGVTVIVILLAVILMERSFISDEKSQIALLKAIGFKDGRIISWHVIRFGIISVISASLALILNKPATVLLLNPIFGIMGGSSIVYKIDSLKVFVIIPIIAVIATFLFTFITAQYSRTIKAADTASIE
ncbi:MAG: ABC transporter permease [Clostridia bacterium]|nr:ABC transporter permease [Clostridia bacterium]